MRDKRAPHPKLLSRPAPIPLSRLIALCLILMTVTTHAVADPLGTLISDLFLTLPKFSQEDLSSLLGREWSEVIFKTGLDPRNVRKANYESIDQILQIAVREKYDILDLLTRSELASRKSPAILLDAKLLDQVDKKFNLHSIWQIKAKLQDPQGPPLLMQFMLIGQGLLVIGYPHGALVEVGDLGESGEYRYEPITLANIVNEPSTRGLFSLRTLAEGQKRFSDFRGPMGTSIKAYEARGSRIRVTYHLVIEQDTEVDRKPIIIRRPDESP